MSRTILNIVGDEVFFIDSDRTIQNGIVKKLNIGARGMVITVSYFECGTYELCESNVSKVFETFDDALVSSLQGITDISKNYNVKLKDMYNSTDYKDLRKAIPSNKITIKEGIKHDKMHK
jgi:hypothetical protein